MCAGTTQMAYTCTGSASHPQHVWCAVHVLCSCAHTVSQMDPVLIALTLSSAQSINYWEKRIWHMYTMWDFWLLLDFLHPKIQHGGKKRTCLEQSRQMGNVLSCISFPQKVILWKLEDVCCAFTDCDTDSIAKPTQHSKTNSLFM